MPYGGPGGFLARLPGRAAGAVQAVGYVAALWWAVLWLEHARRSDQTVVRRGRGVGRHKAVLLTSAPIASVMDAIDARVSDPDRAPLLLGRLHLMAKESGGVVYTLRSKANPRVVCLAVSLQVDGAGTRITVRTYRWTAADGLGAPRDTVRRLIRELRDTVRTADPEARDLEAAAG